MSEQRRIKLSEIDRPARSLRPVRRDSLEYIELVNSVQKDGVLQPILVRPKGERYEIVEGWHRYEASIEAGHDDIPVIVKDLTDREVMILQLKCNAIRPQTRTFEYARRLKLLMEEGLTLTELSGIIDKSPKWIQDQIQLHRLKKEHWTHVEDGTIKASAALALANLPHELQDKFVEEAIVLPAGDFVERASAARRDYQEFLLREKQENRKMGAVPPTLRQMNVIKTEALKGDVAKDVLTACGAKTALEGWFAALSWVLKIDPVSVARRKAGREETERERKLKRKNQDEYRELNRELIKKFVASKSKRRKS